MLGLVSSGYGHRIVDPFATGLQVTGHQVNAIGGSMPGLDSPSL